VVATRNVHSVTAHFARSQIVAAAVRAFAAGGIAATRVEDILTEAGIARRTFYKYFANKEEVLAALYEVSTGELVAAIEDARKRSPDSPLAGIHAGIDIFFGFYRASPRALRELVELAMRSDSLLAPRRKWLRAEVVRILADIVGDPTVDRYVYYAMVSAFEGLCLELGDAGPKEFERARKAALDLVDTWCIRRR
jgi:AcrR family transcriptional regulator